LERAGQQELGLVDAECLERAGQQEQDLIGAECLYLVYQFVGDCSCLPYIALSYAVAVRWNNYVGKSAYRRSSRADNKRIADCLQYVVADVTLTLNTKL
jgi:hypothetical protein